MADATVTKGPHLITVADGNGASFGGVRVLAHAAYHRRAWRGRRRPL